LKKLKDCNTIQDLVNYEKTLNISHNGMFYKTSIVDKDGNIMILNSLSLLDKYYDFLSNEIISVDLSEDEYAEYRMNPKLLSYKLYGTTELWSMILSINNLTSAAEFTLKKINVFTSEIFNLLNEILILEEKKLNKNKKENYL
jgi:hypothetical protein